MKPKSTKVKLLFRIILNILLLLIEATLIINITRSWFVDNKIVETKQVELFSTYMGTPLYLSAVFNNDQLPPNYYNEPILIDKYALPGDILELSVFVDLQNTSYKTLSITTIGMPNWLRYIENSASLLYAEKETDINENVIAIIIDDITPCKAEIIDVHYVDDNISFILSLADDFYVYGNCLALNFKIHFLDEGTNQNDYIGQVINIGFKAQEI